MKNDPRAKWLQYLLTLSVSMPAISMAAPATPEEPVQISQGAAARVNDLSKSARPAPGVDGEVERPIGPWARAWAESWPRTWAESIGMVGDQAQPADGATFGEILDATMRA